MDMKLFQKAVGEWSRKNFPEGKSYQPLLGVCEEAGELCHAHLKHEQGIRGFDSDTKTREEKMDAVGDIVIYLADYCERSNLDFMYSIKRTWEVVEKRSWRKEKD